MGRKRIKKEPLTNAEKQRRYREKRKAEIKTLKALAADIPAAPAAPAELPDMAAIKEQVKAELKKSWEPDIKAERLREARKQARETARLADQNYSNGRIAGICQAADFFNGKDRADICRALLAHFMIDRETAAAVLQDDKRVKSLTLQSLDKSGAWEPPPKIIK
jgi:hypothetical protein